LYEYQSGDPVKFLSLSGRPSGDR